MSDNTNRNIHEFISDAPTLIIGLGGLGCYMANSLYEELSDEQKKYVEAVVLDTDVHELKEDIYETLKNSNSMIQTSPNEVVMSCVNRLRVSKGVEQWFPVDLLDGFLGYKIMPEGAAQVRSISRLAMLDTIKSNRINILNNKLQRLLARRDQQLVEPARIVMINSIAGGTGSGCFLQLALYIRAFFEQKGVTGITVRSFIVMPEVFIQSGDYNSQSLVENVRANGYASLKELDAVCAIRTSQNNTISGSKTLYPIALEYQPNQTDAVEIGIGTPPFDVVTLFDYADAKGGNINSKNNYIENAFDTIRLHLFSPLIGKGGIGSQTDNLINHHIASGNRSNYSSAGVASIEYPIKDMIEYMSLRWAIDGISADWLEIDEQILEEVRRVESLRKEGILQEIPDQNKRFTELVREKCEVQKPTPFYRHIYNDLHVLNERGERTEVKHILWLNKIAKRLEEIVAQAVDEKNKMLVLNLDALKDSENVEPQVRGYEQALSRYQKEMEQRVQNSGLAVAKEVIWSPYQKNMDVLPQQEIQLNTWLLSQSEAMHPLAMRYFLCESIQILTAKLQECKSRQVKTEENLDNYSIVYDNPKTEAIESAVDKARESTGVWSRLKGDLKRFAEEYESKSKAQKNNIELNARLLVQIDCYETLLGYLEDFAETWRIWFNRLENVVNQNKQTINKLASQHDNKTNPTVVYVLASKSIKEKLWEIEKTQKANNQFPADISKQIYTSIYKQKGKQYIDQLPPKQSTKWVSEVFENYVLSWCKQEIAKSDNINMNVSEAIRKELEIDQRMGAIPSDIEPAYQLQSYINKLNALAVPLINLKTGSQGEDFNFVCMHPDVRDAWTPNNIEAIIGKPFVNSGFSEYKISKLAMKYGLCAVDISDIGDENGVYRLAYEQRVAASRKVPRKSTTPHLDDHWDSPAFLPEVDDIKQEKAIESIFEATLLNEAYRLDDNEKPLVFSLKFDLIALWHWNVSKGHPVPIPGLNRKAAEATLFNLVDVFAVNYHLVQEIKDREEQRLKDLHKKPEAAPIIKHAVALLELIYEVPSQTTDLNIGRDRQMTLINVLLKSIYNTISSRYENNLTKQTFNNVMNRLKLDVVGLQDKTSESYVNNVLTYIDNYMD
ncbi:tubulin-like doman-containing protein [Psychrobacter sp. I-STPA10]|uniref:tubulin-like doman-containing protein n=1 Tax=Psychrobacter sp. I-STPA10 TaxID=2585769 RepID=UPI001E5DB4B3|nr:tubulin-like doman-containing protein [Psychrobacter sp. I-STPA10]